MLQAKGHQPRTLYKHLEDQGTRAVLRQDDLTTAQTAKRNFHDLFASANDQSDALTSYQAEFHPRSPASPNEQTSGQSGCLAVNGSPPMGTLGAKIFGLKTTGKLELGKHEKNRSNLHYLMQSDHALRTGGANPEPKVTLVNQEEHFQFGTYHWRRSDVTKSFHPGLVYR